MSRHPYARTVPFRAAMRVLGAAALIVTILGGCSTNAATGRSQLLLVSSSQTAAMGEAAKPELVQQYGGEIPEAPLRAYVTGVGDRLAAQTESAYDGIEWEFIVLESDVINAFALPGGKVFISRGLLERFDNEAQVAGVLGHEIGHVTAQHVDERISHQVSVDVGLSILGAATESDLAVAGGQLFGNGYLLKFGRSQESEADVQGVKYMTKAGYDPHGMLEVLMVLQAASEGDRSPEFLSTHPHPETRIKTVNRLLAGKYAYTQNNADFRKFEGRFERDAVPYFTSR